MILVVVLFDHKNTQVESLLDAIPDKKVASVTPGYDIHLNASGLLANYALALARANLMELDWGIFTHVVVLGNAFHSTKFIHDLIGKIQVIGTLVDGYLLNSWKHQLAKPHTSKFCMNFASTFATAYALVSSRGVRNLGESVDLRTFKVTDDEVKFAVTATRLSIRSVEL